MKSWSAACIFICIISLNIQAGTLTAFQTLETSGARAITPFKLDGHQYLAAAQLAKDIANTPANMNGGDSDVDVLIYQLRGEKFRIYQTIPGHGNEGATFFRLNNQAYLAIPSVRSGSKAPYNLNTYSMVYRWDGKYFIPFQQFYARAAKQWSYFSIGERHFLALATGVETPGKKLADNHSKIYEWNGKEFVLFQDIPSRWGYSFTAFKMDNHDYLGFADHLDGLTIFKWNGKQFKAMQHIEGHGARSLKHFRMENRHYLAFANINKPSKLLQWNGKQFADYQYLAESGGRSFSWFTVDGRHFLLLVRFITGSQERPVTNLDSLLYEWKKGKLQLIERLPGFGAVSAHFFKWDKQNFISLANSLSKDIRFRVNSVIYKIKSENSK